jgi:two-component system, NtrC family, sensor histidine kinase KinB
MLSLRQKMLIGFSGLLLISALIGTISIIQITDLGGAIGSIMKENYISVQACREMKEAAERMDDGVMYILLGYSEKGARIIRTNDASFEKALNAELNNITLPGEHESAIKIKTLYIRYLKLLNTISDGTMRTGDIKKTYFNEISPLFTEINRTADSILSMNQQNMYKTGRMAKQKASGSRTMMYVFLLISASITTIYVFLIGRWILEPITKLTASVDEIRRGNLDLVISAGTKDEIGRLSEAFNEMAASLRDFRRSDEAKMIRLKESAQQTFDHLPNIVAILDDDGVVEMSSKPAREIFGLKKDVNIHDLPYKWMEDIVNSVTKRSSQDVFQKGINVIQHFDNAREYYFQPMAAPVLDNFKQPAGAILIINDITGRIEHDELKTGLISAVSHQLKTPLTSLRMAIYILLDEKMGPLTSGQADLLVTARDESDRLNDIIENLLDISRLESGKTGLKLEQVSPLQLITDAAKRFNSAARDKGVELIPDIPDDLPDVIADGSQIDHVFANLISNSLKYTPSGGTVMLHAEALFDHVWFIISDTGIGIPAQYIPDIFNRFFCVPGQNIQPGTGLGLAIVKEIVEAHGGTIKVESIPGKGSIFTFSLPTAAKQDMPGSG